MMKRNAQQLDHPLSFRNLKIILFLHSEILDYYDEIRFVGQQ